MKFFKIINLSMLFLMMFSCDDEESDTKSDFELIKKESNLELSPEVVKIGERTEYFDFGTDYSRTKIYQIPSRICLEFLDKINVKGDSLSKWGYWRNEGNYLIYHHSVKKNQDFITMEYSIPSHILIVNEFHN